MYRESAVTVTFPIMKQEENQRKVLILSYGKRHI
jgi:hypothetical protein